MSVGSTELKKSAGSTQLTKSAGAGFADAGAEL
jgi:hypothetical protein